MYSGIVLKKKTKNTDHISQVQIMLRDYKYSFLSDLLLELITNYRFDSNLLLVNIKNYLPFSDHMCEGKECAA